MPSRPEHDLFPEYSLDTPSDATCFAVIEKWSGFYQESKQDKDHYHAWVENWGHESCQSWGYEKGYKMTLFEREDCRLMSCFVGSFYRIFISNETDIVFLKLLNINAIKGIDNEFDFLPKIHCR